MRVFQLNKQVVSQLDKLGQSIDHLRVPRLEPRTLTPIDTNPGGQVREFRGKILLFLRGGRLEIVEKDKIQVDTTVPLLLTESYACF